MKNIHDPTMSNPTFLQPVDPRIERYMRSLLERTDSATLDDMENYARQMNFPIVDRLVGVFLYQQARMIQAQSIFEFGSGFGYSAYWFAKAISDDGMVICSDGDHKNAELAENYLNSVGLWPKINFHTGLAQDIFKQQDGLFDICYNDVDKGDYPEVWKMAKQRIRPGGLYIADNVLWHGRVALDEYQDLVEGWTEAIKEHNQLIFDDPEFESFINPTRDGVIVARKIC